MLKKVQAIILRTVKYSETSIICDAFTLELGLRTYIISGVRKKNAKVSPGLVRPMSFVEMVVYHQEEKDINRIKELKPNLLYQQIPFDIYKGTVGLFITEIAQKTVKESVENPSLYAFLRDTYQLLDSTAAAVANFPLWFLIQYAQHLGIAPDLSDCQGEGTYYDYKMSQVTYQNPNHTACFLPEQVICIQALEDNNYEKIASLKIEPMQRRKLLQEWIAYYQYHVDGFGLLNSLEVLQEVF